MAPGQRGHRVGHHRRLRGVQKERPHLRSDLAQRDLGQGAAGAELLGGEVGLPQGQGERGREWAPMCCQGGRRGNWSLFGVTDRP